MVFGPSSRLVGGLLANHTLQRTGGTVARCGSVAQSESGGSAAPAAERGALGHLMKDETTGSVSSVGAIIVEEVMSHERVASASHRNH